MQFLLNNTERTRILYGHFLFGIATAAAFFTFAPVADAGFGITPPYVFNDRLTRGTVYEQRIGLVRSDPNEDLKVEVTMNIPGIESWFSIDRGREFIIPKGASQISMVVTVRVPDDAEYKQYKGAIRVRTSPNSPQPSGGVSIALGAQIDVDVTVVDKIYDFSVRKIGVLDLEEGRTRWGLFFPGKIKFLMTIENTGNTEYGPSKVTFDMYDSEMETLLESIENTNDIERISPFGTKEVIAELPTRLPPGRYAAKYTIYRGDEIAQQNQITVSINPLGTVAGYEGYGFSGLSLQDKLKALSYLGMPVALVGTMGGAVVVRRRRRARMRVYPKTTQLL